MATKQFAIPLDSSSKQTGDITFKKLVMNAANVEFRLTNTQAGAGDPQLNLITSNDGVSTNHIYNISVVNGVAQVTLTVPQMKAVYDDAIGGDWDYVEADWELGAVDTPGTSVNSEIQSGRTYDMNGWPPNS
jgi:hypothetical protein